MSNLTKVTEIVGRFERGTDDDGIDPEHGRPLVGFSGMIPDGAVNARGRWRITVEFEPEEER